MKLAISGILLIFFAAAISAQSVASELLANPYETACGKPLSDGKVYDFREGRVTGITKDNILVFEQSDVNGSSKTETLRVRLAGIASNGGDDKLNTLLTRELVRQEVVVVGNKKKDSDDELLGMVWITSLGDINQHLLKKRIAMFSEPDYDAVSKYSICVLKQLGGKHSS